VEEKKQGTRKVVRRFPMNPITKNRFHTSKVAVCIELVIDAFDVVFDMFIMIRDKYVPFDDVFHKRP
jgi:hypothetical protein